MSKAMRQMPGNPDKGESGRVGVWACGRVGVILSVTKPAARRVNTRAQGQQG